MGESAELMPRAGERRSLRRRTPPSPLLAGALADLAAAATAAEVAAVAAEHAVELTGARAAAVGVIGPTRAELVLVGSAGYDCDAMAPGARLPLDAGLPITEAARTGAAVVRTTSDGGWVAVPLLADPAAGVGALLVSLTAGGGGNAAGPDVDLLAELAGHVRRALHRAPGAAGPATTLRAVGRHPSLHVAGSLDAGSLDDGSSPDDAETVDYAASADGAGSLDDPVSSSRRRPADSVSPAPLAPTVSTRPAQRTLSRSAARRVATARRTATSATAGQTGVAPAQIGRLDIAVRIDPLLRDTAAAGGDLVEVVPDGHGGGWIVVADACGADAAAGATAAMTGLLVRALGPHLDDPVELLEEIDALLASEGASRYVTALAMRVDADPEYRAVGVRLASAGHPLPLVALSGTDLTGTEPSGTDLTGSEPSGTAHGSTAHGSTAPIGTTRTRTAPSDTAARSVAMSGTTRTSTAPSGVSSMSTTPSGAASRSTTPSGTARGGPAGMAATRVGELLVDPCAVGLPLNLGLGDPLGLRGVDFALPAGASLLCFTDGLTDRRDRSMPLDIVEDVFVRSVSLFADATTALDTVFDVLAAGQGAPGDDAAAALLRVR